MNDFLDNLYSNIGTKIKNFVKWCFLVETIAIVIGGFILLLTSIEEIGGVALIVVPVAAAVSILVSFVLSWIAYAFGDLVENANETRICTAKIHEKLCRPEETKKEVPAPKKLQFSKQDNRKTDGKWKCPQCHWINTEKDTECVCGYRR